MALAGTAIPSAVLRRAMISPRVALLVVVLSMASGTAIADRISPTPEQLHAWKDLESSSSVPPANRRITCSGGVPLVVHWSHRSGTPATIRVKEPVSARGVQRIARSQAEWVAARFLDENATALFAMRADRDSFRYARTAHSHGKWEVFFNQTWRGVPVEGSGCMVRLAFDGSLERMSARWVSDVDRGGRDWIVPLEAERRALAGLRHRKWGVSRIQLKRRGLHHRFVYELTLLASANEARVCVDVVTGEIRSRSIWIDRSAMVR